MPARCATTGSWFSSGNILHVVDGWNGRFVILWRFGGLTTFMCITKIESILIKQELEMWNRNCLYKVSFCKFHGLQGRPRFCHITTVKNGPLYFWEFALFQVAILLKCVLMSGSPLCRGQLLLKLTKNKKCTEKKWLGALILYSKHLAKFVAGSSFWWVPLTTQSQISLYKMGTNKTNFQGHSL